MIQITDEQVEKYMSISLEKYGVPMDKHKARDELTALLCLLVAVHRHMKQRNWPDVSTI